MIDFLIKINSGDDLSKFDFFLINPKFRLQNIKYGRIELYLWGDPIFDPENCIQNHSKRIDLFISELCRKVQGHYYYMAFDKELKYYYFGNSLFGILPLYYTIKKESLYLSSSSKLIANHLKIWKRDRRFILENVLFNYPIFNHSAFDSISLLPTNNFLEWSEGNAKLHKHTNFEDMFILNNLKTSQNLDYLSDLFIKRSSLYFPDSLYIHALTGGFDGRTLVSCAKYHKKSFETYSFGTAESTDTQVARTLSKRASIPYNHFLLDREYIEKMSYQNGLDFINNSSGAATFARAHYLMAAKELSKKTSILVTGNFGSEIFRAANNAGAVISSNLYHLFRTRDFSKAIIFLKSSPENNWLNHSLFKEEWESLIEDLKELPAFSSKYNDLTLNQKLYITIFEEVFRKYFGAEMINQYKYLINRTPFLDFQFFIQLMETSLAGIHSNLFEHNPLKRIKGQMLYSHIIQKSHQEYSHIALDKGYKPNDLLDFSGKLRLTKAYVKKNISKRSDSRNDPFAVHAAFIHNKPLLEKEIINSQLFDLYKIHDSLLNNETRHNIFEALSQAIYIKNS